MNIKDGYTNKDDGKPDFGKCFCMENIFEGHYEQPIRRGQCPYEQNCDLRIFLGCYFLAIWLCFLPGVPATNVLLR